MQCTVQHTVVHFTIYCSVLYIIMQCIVHYTVVNCTSYCSVLNSSRGGVCQANQTLMTAGRDGCISLHLCSAAHCLYIVLHMCSAPHRLYIVLHTTHHCTLHYTTQYNALYNCSLHCTAPTSHHCTTLVPLHAELVLPYSWLLHFYCLHKHALDKSSS